MSTTIIEKLSKESQRRTCALRIELAQRLSEPLPDDVAAKICIYATGSLARQEASPYSDLDAFFYVLGSRADKKIEPVNKITTFFHVIEAAKCNSFPDFSGGGEYLHFQYLSDVVDNIGSREDDYINGLTSRMLLILESSYLFNESQYLQARKAVVERYFVDFHDHSSDFRPIFILNDVLRFWRTLCLNYEHGREWRKDDPRDRARGHLKNLKLRFSRLMICYSFIAALLQEGPALSADQVIEIVSKTPTQRLEALRDTNGAIRSNVVAALEDYSWFLSAMNADKEDVLNWISDDSERTIAFDRSKSFINAMYNLVVKIAGEHNYTRYLVI